MGQLHVRPLELLMTGAKLRELRESDFSFEILTSCKCVEGEPLELAPWGSEFGANPPCLDILYGTTNVFSNEPEIKCTPVVQRTQVLSSLLLLRMWEHDAGRVQPHVSPL